MTYNGICIRHQAKRTGESPFRYKQGQKRCSVCEIFIKWDKNVYCPCCNYKLRTRSFRGFQKGNKVRELTIKMY